MHRPPRIFAAIVLLVAIAFLYGGVRCSPWAARSTIAGRHRSAGVGDSALARQQARLAYLGALLAATLLWSVFEVGTDLWALAPRLGFLSVLGAWLLTPFARRGLYRRSSLPRCSAALEADRSQPPARSRWSQSSSSVRATRPTNCRRASLRNEASPRRRGRRMASLRQHHARHALRASRPDRRVERRQAEGDLALPHRPHRAIQGDAAADRRPAVRVHGDERHRRARCRDRREALGVRSAAEDRAGRLHGTCRGVSYYRAPERLQRRLPRAHHHGHDRCAPDRCRCEDRRALRRFGTQRRSDLMTGIGEAKPDIYLVTTPPLIARKLAVLGARVADNFEVERALRRHPRVRRGHRQVRVGVGHGTPGVNTEPAEGEQYTRGTPNVWSADELRRRARAHLRADRQQHARLLRRASLGASEKYASSVVALDVATAPCAGRSRRCITTSGTTTCRRSRRSSICRRPTAASCRRWCSRPSAASCSCSIDAPARRSPKSRSSPVPQGAVPNEWLAKTQPFSVGMPSFRPDVTEADMWGLTPFDQMWCRIEFRKMRYEGHFTPPSIEGTLRVSRQRRRLQLGRRRDRRRQSAAGRDAADHGQPPRSWSRATRCRRTRSATSSSARRTRPTSACSCRRFDAVHAAAVRTHRGRRPARRARSSGTSGSGTTNESGPWGRRSACRLPMGVPLAAGSIVTQGRPDLLRRRHGPLLPRVRREDGDELWRDYLPAPAQATPMSYLSPQTKRQIVVITVPARAASAWPSRKTSRRRSARRPHHRLRAQRHSEGIASQRPRRWRHSWSAGFFSRTEAFCKPLDLDMHSRCRGLPCSPRADRRTGPDDGCDPGDGMGAGAVHGVWRRAAGAQPTADHPRQLRRFMDAPCRSHARDRDVLSRLAPDTPCLNRVPRLLQ